MSASAQSQPVGLKWKADRPVRAILYAETAHGIYDINMHHCCYFATLNGVEVGHARATADDAVADAENHNRKKHA